MKDVFSNVEIPVLMLQPTYQAAFCFGGNWDFSLPVSTKMPNRFHRFMQRWLLDIHWREL